MSTFSFVTPNVEMITEPDPLKRIELAARTCYKSEDKITDTSAKKMVRNLMRAGHTAMVEHAVVVFDISGCSKDLIDMLAQCRYAHITCGGGIDGHRCLVSANVRAVNEMAPKNLGYFLLLCVMNAANPGLVYPGASDMLKFAKTDNGSSGWLHEQMNELVCGHIPAMVDIDSLEDATPEEIEQHKYLTFRFTTDRGVTHEMVRHRPASYGQESTRYVNYKDGISICLPTGFYERPAEVQEEYQQAFADADRHYRKLIEMGQTPQQARAVLPTALKTEIVMTANVSEWNHVWNLRLFGATGAPHPDIKAVMWMAYNLAAKDPTIVAYRKVTGKSITV